MTNREKLHAWLDARGGAYAASARAALIETVERATGDVIRPKSIDSWLADPAANSARPCPGWVLYVLQQSTN